MEAIFYITLFIFILLMGLLYGNVDYDFWARLIVGKTFFQTGEVLKSDFMSYTPHHPWYDHEWGSSVIFYFVQNNFGEVGLYIFKAILVFLTLYLVTQVIKLRFEIKFKEQAKYGFYLSFLFFFFAIHATISTLFAHIRCQSLSFLLVALWIYVLERARLKNEKRLLWIMPVTMFFWVNCHGGCASGLGIFALYIIGIFLDKKPIKEYLISFALSIAVCFINPYGIEYIKYLITATTMKRQGITEWRSTLSQEYLLSFYKFKMYVVFIFILEGIGFIKSFLSKHFWHLEFVKEKWEKCDKVKFLIMLVMFALSIKAVRFIPYFVLCSLCFCYNDFYALFDKKLPKFGDIAKEIIILILVSIAFLYEYKSIGGFVSKASNTFPVTEVEFLKTVNYKGNLLTYFHLGSYAMYSLYPNVHLYMDGRYEEIYHDDVLGNLSTFLSDGNVDNLNGEWKEALNKYHTDMIILEKNLATYNALLKDNDWELLLRSEGSPYALFGRRGKYKNDKPIKRFLNVREVDKNKFNTMIDWAK